jgi:hypothetical protein
MVLAFPDPALSTARREVEAAVMRLVLAHDPTAVVDEPPMPGASWTEPRPAPMPAVAAALVLHRTVRRQIHDHIARARGAGHTWLEIADATGLAPHTQPWQRELAAFDLVAITLSNRDHRSTSWRCATCRQIVTDHGPDAARGDDEHGHATTCTRRLAQLAAWEAQDASWAAGNDLHGADR